MGYFLFFICLIWSLGLESCQLSYCDPAPFEFATFNTKKPLVSTLMLSWLWSYDSWVIKYLKKMSASFLALWVWELIRMKKITILLPSSLPPQYKENNVMSTVMLSWLWSFTVIGFKNENIFCSFACMFGRLQRKMVANLTLLIIKL